MVAGKPGKLERDLILDRPRTVGWRLQMLKLTPEMDSGANGREVTTLLEFGKGKRIPWVPLGLETEQLTLKSVLQMWSGRRPWRPKLDFSDCYLRCLGDPEINVISVCRKRTYKDLENASETFKALLGKTR
ncbi:hypothetical protein CRG98_002216 [Punica granatum]|uniref:Uncharacterized protein n=1 Tax=Punica granatum TaxID=22663 RepID=A0A2I0LB29_PUNGR|nr:hypothetical protein CRG98_002216 [Punica granatum]